MGCFTTLLLLLLGIIFLVPDLRPLMDIEGFWLVFGAIWAAYFISWLLFGDIADAIAGVDRDYDE